MAGKRILVLGGGFGGITAARELRRGLSPEHAITLVDRRGTFVMGLRKLWVLVGRGSFAQGTRALGALSEAGVHVRVATVRAIDTQRRQVRVDDGAIPFDYLIVALGAEPRPDLVPGFSDAVTNLYDHADVERLASRLRTFTRGRIHVAVLGVPYKCPPAPYEAAMMLDDYFRRRGLRGEIAIDTSTPQPMSLPVVGAAGCAHVEGLLGGKGIGFTPNRKVAKLDGSTLVSEGTSIAADLLIGVPPHRPPAVIRESGLPLRGEWIAVDAATLRTAVDGVFAVGDVIEVPLANGMALPKAGVFAESQAAVAAGAIIAELTGRAPPAPFDGRGYCFVETGGEQAAMVQGEFLATPAPRVQIAPPSPSAYQQKLEFERSRLASWFSVVSP
jgi:sulfide:quinone oxidoreductase